MSDFQELGRIKFVTDTENSYDYIGEVQGGFSDGELKNYIEKYGTKSLLETLAYMQWRVWQTVREINGEKSNLDCVKACIKEN